MKGGRKEGCGGAEEEERGNTEAWHTPTVGHQCVLPDAAGRLTCAYGSPNSGGASEHSRHFSTEKTTEKRPARGRGTAVTR